jgi:hypothetical protein
MVAGKTKLGAIVGVSAAVLGSGSSAWAQSAWWDGAEAAAPPVIRPAAPLPPAPTVAQLEPPAEAPQGDWVYTATYGWVWVPAGAATAPVGEEPYAYLYTPTYGWTWCASPWGSGPYFYGEWASNPWQWSYAPRVWAGRTWVTPRVAPRAYHSGYDSGYGAPRAYAAQLAARRNVAPPAYRIR